EAPRRLLRLHQIRVVSDRGEPYPRRYPQSVGIVILRGIVPRDLLRQVRRKPTIALPNDEMRAVRAIDHIDRLNAALHLLPDALKHALGAGAFYPNVDTGKPRLEGLGELLRDRQIHGAVEGELAFLFGPLHQRRRDRLGSGGASLRADCSGWRPCGERTRRNG